jgi:hypothetical protein
MKDQIIMLEEQIRQSLKDQEQCKKRRTDFALQHCPSSDTEEVVEADNNDVEDDDDNDNDDDDDEGDEGDDDDMGLRSM